MAKDIRKLFEDDNKLSNDTMPKGHEARFLDKLETALPQEEKLANTQTEKPKFNWLRLVASIVVLLGIGYGVFTFWQGKEATKSTKVVEVEVEKPETKTLGDISPDLKKVEDYYVANINLELSKMKMTPENKELFDSYIAQLENLNLEYQKLSEELTTNGPDELTVNALINNLKFRLNLMYRLKEQLKELNIEATKG